MHNTLLVNESAFTAREKSRSDAISASGSTRATGAFRWVGRHHSCALHHCCIHQIQSSVALAEIGHRFNKDQLVPEQVEKGLKNNVD
jgi:hypothetical protein